MKKKSSSKVPEPIAPALIDPPGVFAPVEEWLEFRDELLRSNIPHIQPHIDEANRAIAHRLARCDCAVVGCWPMRPSQPQGF